MPKLTASIVLYKSSIEQISNLVDSIIAAGCVDKLYIIDNYPLPDNKVFFDSFDFVEYIPHENTGYGSSHNISLNKAIEECSDYHVILNPDIEIEKDCFQSIMEYMDIHTDVGYLLPHVIYPDGELQYLCRHLPTPIDLFARRFGKNLKIMKKIDDKYSLKCFSYQHILNPPCLSGCFMFLRVATIRDNDLFFDDRYFMYFEDFDLIRRIHKVSKTIYYPYVTIIHSHARESHTNKKMFFVFVKSLIKYFNKWGWFFDKERRLWNNEVDEEIKRVDYAK